MQVEAILEAACTVKKEGHDVHPEIMIPLAWAPRSSARCAASSTPSPGKSSSAEAWR